MDVYETEEQQIEALKRFWKDYGVSIAVGIVVALAVIFGWRYWQSAQLKADVERTQQYQGVLDAMMKAQGEGGGDVKKAETDLQRMANKLLDERPSSMQAQMSVLTLAQLAMAKKDYAEAEKRLRQVLSSKPEEGLRVLATMRLARVLAAKGDNKAALELLDKEHDPSFAAGLEELRGDIHVLLGQKDKARAAYKSALDILKKRKEERPLVQIKLDDLA